MDTSFVPTFVACGAIFALSFFMIWVFWFVERLRGCPAPLKRGRLACKVHEHQFEAG